MSREISTGGAYVCPSCGQWVPLGQSHTCPSLPVGDAYVISPESGWECPKCGRVYSPAVKECHWCNEEKNLTGVETGESDD
jgi:hypothetical protein